MPLRKGIGRYVRFTAEELSGAVHGRDVLLVIELSTVTNFNSKMVLLCSTVVY